MLEQLTLPWWRSSNDFLVLNICYGYLICKQLLMYKLLFNLKWEPPNPDYIMLNVELIFFQKNYNHIAPYTLFHYQPPFASSSQLKSPPRSYSDLKCNLYYSMHHISPKGDFTMHRLCPIYGMEVGDWISKVKGLDGVILRLVVPHENLEHLVMMERVLGPLP
ncbi:hypothetical protein FRX31_003386 [Thalictrum thalictroides]|uniref:Uncharacterized protein n=1 Tax=Thalictrum thalictroides TaxID=46969 RepID=A0A7J6XDE3_THATH|nr:hypothetical protein FRX31_003386 [Thalictrum thalictroides]